MSLAAEQFVALNKKQMQTTIRVVQIGAKG